MCIYSISSNTFSLKISQSAIPWLYILPERVSWILINFSPSINNQWLSDDHYLNCVYQTSITDTPTHNLVTPESI